MDRLNENKRRQHDHSMTEFGSEREVSNRDKVPWAAPSKLAGPPECSGSEFSATLSATVRSVDASSHYDWDIWL